MICTIIVYNKRYFVKVTPKVLKYCLDGFALIYRNGLAYLKEEIPSYATSYTTSDYLRFIYERNNQMCYEDELTLGIHKRPLSYEFIRNTLLYFF